MLHRPATVEAEAGARLLGETLIWLRKRIEKDWPKAVG